MDNFLKVRYFDELFEIFSSQREGWYAFYADYTNMKVHWSQEMVDYFGMPSRVMDDAEALSYYTSLIHPDDFDQFNECARKMLDGETDELSIPYRIRNKKGEYTTVSTFSKFKRDEEGKPVFYAGTVVNYEKNDTIEPTTGLFTIRYMMEKMEEYELENKAYFLMIFEIKDFSSLKNKYDYITENKILRTVGEIALNNRNGAMVFKLEAARFAMLKAFDIGDESIKTFGEIEFDNIRNDIINGLEAEGKNVYIDIYGGAVYTDESGINAQTAYTSALFALEKAKKNEGSCKLNVFNQSSMAEDKHRLSVYNAIRESILNGCEGFYMVYQPIISNKSGKLTSMEALLRWHGDKYGEVPPAAFIEWIEKDPSFYILGNWIIKKVLEDSKEVIRRVPDLIVNINLAYPQLIRDDFEKDLKAIIEESGVDPKNVRMELTERCKLLDLDLLKEKINFMRELGMQTSLDDFGTGYSAINLLFDLSINQIKIDKFFIDNIENEGAKRIMLKAIVDCARDLGAHVCVEGIENKEMADYVSNHFNITSLQGYYYSKPVPLEDFMKKLNSKLESEN